MSRSGYTDDCWNGWDTIMWRGAVASAMNGKRGQAFLRETLAALDALPEKKLIAEELEDKGCFCTLGAVGHARGIDMSNIDTENERLVANTFGIARAMACEIMWVNDDAGGWNETPEQRWIRVRRWIASQIKEEDGK